MFPTHRAWTTESIAAFNTKRDEQCAKRGLKPFRQLNAEDKVKFVEQERLSTIDMEWKQLTLQAYPLEKYPMKQYTAPSEGLLLCPKAFKLRHISTDLPAVTEVPFRKGQDLYSVVYHHYAEEISQLPPTSNYVNNDGISTRRHEYLGPAPCVAGFRMTGNEVDILFWDSYLQLAWLVNDTWSVDVEFDKNVESWFPIVRCAA